MNSHTHEMLKLTQRCIKITSRQQRFLLVCLFLAACQLPMAAQQPSVTPTPPPPGTSSTQGPIKEDPCADYKVNKNLDNFILCAQKRFDDLSWHGIRPVVGGVVPGSGFGGGIGYSSGVHRKEGESNGVSVAWQREFKADAKVTYRKYWQAEANYTIIRTRNDFSSPSSGGSGLDLPDLTMNLYGQVKDMPRLDYYGLGPETDRSGLVKFHYREAVIGADVKRAAANWLDVGGAVEGIWPQLTPITEPNVRAIEQAYTDLTAPGLLADPAYLRLTGYAGLHSPGQPERRKLSYDFYYNVYYDWKDGRYSFRRFEADLKHKFRLGSKSELRVRGRLSLSETSEGQRVPFYLQETLGGSNIRGDDTLRGFDDYRFRDRNFALFQTDFIREIHGPLRLIVFYDAGKVAPSVERFDRGRLRQTYGLGAVIMSRQLDKIMFRFYIALGSGEGSHIFFGPGESILGGSSKLAR